MQTILGEQTSAFTCLYIISPHICQIIHPNYFILGILDAELGTERTHKLNKILYACSEQKKSTSDITTQISLTHSLTSGSLYPVTHMYN